MQKFLKPTIYLAALVTIWLGPEKIFLQTNAHEEKLHIAIVAISLILMTIIKLAPSAPNAETQAINLSQTKRLFLLKKQLRFQWHWIKQKVPFNLKHSQIQLVITDKGAGASTIMQGFGEIECGVMPFDISWHYNSNSLICLISTNLFAGGKAQHNQQLFEIIKKRLKISKAYLILPVTKVMHDKIDQSLDAFNYTLTAFNQTDKIDVKLILSKCDKIAGFVPYFEHYGNDLKQKDWKINFANINDFNKKFEHLVTEINQNLITRMHIEAQLYRRILIKDFPIQLEKLKQNISNNLQHLINNNYWQINSLALTSATQDGSYNDLISHNIGMQTNHKDILITKQRYFCNHLFDIQTVNITPFSSIIYETWFQVIALTMAVTIAMFVSQLWWLERFNDITEYSSIQIKPKVILEKDAGVWHRWQLAKKISPWIKQHPIPNFFKPRIWQKNLDHIEDQIHQAVLADLKNCNNSGYICLERKWQPFISALALSERLEWVKQNRKKLALDEISPTEIKLADSEEIQLYLSSNIPSEPSEQINWLKDLVKLIDQKNIPLISLNIKKFSSQIELQTNRERLVQMISILENLGSGAKSFSILQTLKPMKNALPKNISELEKEILQKLRTKMIQHINQVWQATILASFDKIKDKFPINQNSNVDLSASELARLFEMNRFFAKYYLEPAKKLAITSNNLTEIYETEKFLSGDLKFSFMAKDGIMSDISVAQLNVAGSVINLASQKSNMYHWPLTGPDDTISLWLQNKAGKLSMSSRHGTWGIFRFINSAGQIKPGSKAAKLVFPVGEQRVTLSIYFERPWANLAFKLPHEIV